MATTEAGHAPSRCYVDQDGQFHLNGSSIYIDESGNAVDVVDFQQLDSGSKMVSGGSALTATAALHAGRTIKLDTAAGTTVTLPAASGTGNIYRFVITTIATSNSHVIKVANSSDTMVGAILTISDDPATTKGFKASGTDDTITLNRTTTGSTALGEFIEVQDIAANLWLVRGTTLSTGTEATPFSATV